MIIGLCGAPGSGKDTVGNILVSKYGFVKMAFADALKDVVSIMFSWPRNMIEGGTEESRIWRETVDPSWSLKTGIDGFTPRKALQIIGTDLMRNQVYKDIWIDIIENKLRNAGPTAKIVITDCRFGNEIDLLRKFPNTRILKIFRTSSSQHNTHQSETQNITYDFVIQNDNTINDLQDNIHTFLLSGENLVD